MTSIVISQTNRRGINRHGFKWIRNNSQEVDLQQEAMKSLFGQNFIGTEDVSRVWEISKQILLPKAILDLTEENKREVWKNYILYYDSGISPREMYNRFGQESVDETFEDICTALELWDVTVEPSWQLLPYFGGSRTNDYRHQTTNEFRSVLYAMQMLYLLRKISLTNVYWMRTSRILERGIDFSGAVALSHQKGLAQASVLWD